MAKKKMKLRLGDLLLDPDDNVGVIQHMPEVERDPIVVHWFKHNESYAYQRELVESWRKAALDRRQDFM